MPQRLKQARERLGWTLDEAGAHLGISGQYIWKLENGVNAPPAWERLRDFCREYEVSSEWVFDFTDDPTPARKAVMPSYGTQMLSIMRSMPEPKQAELYDVARAMADHAAQAAEDDAVRAMAVAAIDALLGPLAQTALEQLVQRITNGDKAGALEELRLILERQRFAQHNS